MTHEQAAAEAQNTVYGAYAGFFTRLIARLIDRAILSGILALLGVATTWLLDTFQLNTWIQTSQYGALIVIAIVVVLYITIELSYTIGFWLLAGQTPGKRVMGVRIVRTGGRRINPWSAIRRYVGYWLSSILYLGYLWVLVDNRRQGWHDKLAGTLVVYSWPEDELQGTFVRDRVQRFRERRQKAQEP